MHAVSVKPKLLFASELFLVLHLNLNAEGTLYAIGCLANTDFDPEKMDFNFGDPSYEIAEFMGFVTGIMARLDVENIDADRVKELFKKLTAFHKKWKKYGFGNDIKKTFKHIKSKW